MRNRDRSCSPPFSALASLKCPWFLIGTLWSTFFFFSLTSVLHKCAHLPVDMLLHWDVCLTPRIPAEECPLSRMQLLILTLLTLQVPAFYFY